MIVRNLLAGFGIIAVIAVSAGTLNAYYWQDTDSVSPPRLNVSFRGLDLATPEGVDMLNARIRTAVHQICDTGGTQPLSYRRAETQCRERAFASAAPQVERAIAQARHPVAEAERTVFTDLDQQPGSIRKAATSALVRALVSGVTANWYGRGARGLVYAQDRYIDDHGRYCGMVTVTARSHGQQQVVTNGRACAVPDDQFPNL